MQLACRVGGVACDLHQTGHPTSDGCWRDSRAAPARRMPLCDKRTAESGFFAARAAPGLLACCLAAALCHRATAAAPIRLADAAERGTFNVGTARATLAAAADGDGPAARRRRAAGRGRRRVAEGLSGRMDTGVQLLRAPARSPRARQALGRDSPSNSKVRAMPNSGSPCRSGSTGRKSSN